MFLVKRILMEIAIKKIDEKTMGTQCVLLLAEYDI